MKPIAVMVVDDDLMVRSTIRTLLSQHEDLRITGVFDDGRAALDAVESCLPDVMVVDIVMPAMNGSELVRQVRSRFPQVKVLVYTSLPDEQWLSEMLNAGAAGVVYKDAPVSSLADAIRATFAGLSVLSPRFSSRLARPEVDEPLSGREIQILRLVSRGMTNEQIAPEVGMSPSTVKYHIARLSEKLGAHNRVTLAVAAVHLGLVNGSDPEPQPDTGWFARS